MKYEIGDIVTDETGHYIGVVCIKWDDGDLCTIENDAAHPNPRQLTNRSSRAAGAVPVCKCVGNFKNGCLIHDGGWKKSPPA